MDLVQVGSVFIDDIKLTQGSWVDLVIKLTHGSCSGRLSVYR